MMTSIHELLQKEAQAVLNIPITAAYEKAVELIVEQIHRQKGKLVTTGMGCLLYTSDIMSVRIDYIHSAAICCQPNGFIPLCYIKNDIVAQV